MKMTTIVAFENMKYHRSKNILTGIAIILTTLLLFIVPTVGNGMIDAQYAVVNKVYPTWHAFYRGVDREAAGKLAAHHDISVCGLHSDVRMMKLEDASVTTLSVDKLGAELYRMDQAEGSLPVGENEIVVSAGILEALGQKDKLGVAALHVGMVSVI